MGALQGGLSQLDRRNLFGDEQFVKFSEGEGV
jgi:hypothetical protein